MIKTTLSVLVFLTVVLSMMSFHMANASTFTAIRSGNWTDNSTWGQSPPLVIGENDVVIIPSGISVNSLKHPGVTFAIEDSGIIDLVGTWTNKANVKITQNGSLNNLGTFENYFGTLSNSGKINNTGTISDSMKGFLYNEGKIYNKGNITQNVGMSGLSNFGTIINDGNLDFAHSAIYIGGVLVNNGHLNIGANSTASNSGLLSNSGIFLILGDLLNIGRINNLDTGRMENLAIINNDNGAVFSNDGIIVNKKTINNIGNPPVRNSIMANQGTIDNEGVLNSYSGVIINYVSGVIINDYLGRPITDPQGVINNYGNEFSNYGRITNTPNAVIQNAEVITNYCGGIVDNSGTITIHQIVNISCDSIPPKIVAPNDITVVSRGALAMQLGTPTVSDNVDRSPIVVNNSTGFFQVGVTTITWTATDHSGNVGMANQRVVVLTPDQAIEGLVLSSEDVGANVHMLKEISTLLDDGKSSNDVAVCGKLDAFYNHLVTDKEITQLQRSSLVQQVNLIKSWIPC